MASTVTYIIGNGLDLSIGLDTSYRNFYDYVRANNLHPKNKIYEAIQNDPETWADFEIALGRYTWFLQDISEKRRKKESIDFHNELDQVIEDLADYLEIEEKKIEDKAVKTEFTRDGFYEELPSGQRLKISPYVNSGPLAINFVTLNYTNTLEKILPNRNVHLMNINAVIRSIHHLHGDLYENVTLGVSDESQLFGDMPSGERDDLIKPRLIASMNDDRLETFDRLIDASSVLVLYGTSIGESDKYIWRHIVSWLAFDEDRYIIVHRHDSTYSEKTKRLPRRQKLFIRAVQDNLLTYSDLDDDELDELRSRILVIHNTKKLLAKK